MKIHWKNKISAALVGMGFLIALSVVMGWSALRVGSFWYLDNPAHLAEIMERVQPNWSGWSDLAFCGFPLGQWHSPVAYGVLAGLVRLGAPLGVVYTLALWTAFLFPALVLFFGARKRTGEIRAVLLASLLLLQPSALVGIASAWGGMWTFYLAAGGLLWLMQRWSSGRGGLLGDAVLIGAIGLTHLFVFVTIPLLALLRILVSFRRTPSEGRPPVAVIGACLVGVLAATAYWLPAWLVQSGGWTPQNLSPGRVLWALAVPSNLQVLTSAAPIAWREFWQLGTLPMLTLIGLGLFGGLRPARSGKSHPGRFGLLFALAVLAGLLLLPMLPAALNWVWGPASWRLLYLARLGLVWSAVEVLASRQPRPMNASAFGRRLAVGGLLLIALGWGIAAPLRQAIRDPGKKSHREVHALWDAIRSSTTPDDPGRIYLQDTYQNPDIPPGLARTSHILAFTAAATGVRQLGAYYGMAPQPTAAWTSSEFGRLCGVRPGDSQAISTVLERLRRGACSRMVVSSPIWIQVLDGQEGITRQYQSDWFTLFQLGDLEPNGIEILRPGEIEIDIDVFAPDKPIRISQAWHPDWRLDDARSPAHLVSDESGLLRIDKLPPGTHPVQLRYAPPHWPRWISRITWLGLLLAVGWNRLSLMKRRKNMSHDAP